MKKLAIIMTLVIVASSALMAFEHNNGKDGLRHKDGKEMRQRSEHREMGEQNGMMVENMAEELELSEKVVAEIKDLKIENQKANITLKAQIEVLKVDRRKVMMNKDFFEIKKINSQISKLKLQLTNSRVDLHENIWNKLSPKQQAKCEKLRKEHQSEAGKEHNRGKHRKM